MADPARTWQWATFTLTAGAIGAGVVMAPHAGATPTVGLALLVFLGSSLHVASTGWIYTQPEVRVFARRHPGRYVWVPLGSVAGAAALAALLSPAGFVWLLLPYFSWQFFHFQKQNLGMAALSAASQRTAPLHATERYAIVGTGVAGITALLAHPALLQLQLPYHSNGLFLLAQLLFGLCGVTGTLALGRRPAGDRPAGFCAVFLMALLFPLPIFVFSTPYAAVSGMTVAHGLQYLLLMGTVAYGPVRTPARAVSVAMLLNIALVGGVLLSTASHLHGGAPAVRLLFGAYLGFVMAHFVIDAGFWRLRDPFPRAFLAGRAGFLLPSGGALADRSSADIGSAL